MITKKYYTDRDFDTLESFFAYIVSSQTNGQQRQVRTYLQKMSLEQLGDFILFIISNYNSNVEILTMVAENLQTRQQKKNGNK